MAIFLYLVYVKQSETRCIANINPGDVVHDLNNTDKGLLENAAMFPTT